MIILGIDPGSTRIGYGVIKWEHSQATCIIHGIIDFPGTHDSPKYIAVERELTKIIRTYKPDIAGIEKLFFSRNRTTSMAVSEMRGVICLTLAHHSIPTSELTPLQVKQYVSGYGHAEKRQVQRMVQLLLNLKDPIKSDDAADALAIALCCAHN